MAARLIVPQPLVNQPYRSKQLAGAASAPSARDAFPRRKQIVRIDRFRVYQHPHHAGADGLLDEARYALTERVHLDGQLYIRSIPPAQHDQPVENRLPVFVGRTIVIGDEETPYTMCRISPERSSLNRRPYGGEKRAPGR